MKKQILAGLLLVLVGAGSQSAIEAQRRESGKTPATKAHGGAGASRNGEFAVTEGVTAAQLKDYLDFIASDEMEGRDTPSRGLNLTAKFIALHLSRWGLKPLGTDGSFLQKFGLQQRQLFPDQTSVAFNGQALKMGDDFIAQSYPGGGSGQLVFVGHGFVVKAKNVDAYQGVDVKDKIMIVADAYPKNVTHLDLRGRKIGVDFDRPEHYASTHGAKAVILIPNSSILNSWEARYQDSLSPTQLVPENPELSRRVPTILASAKLVAALFQGEQLDYETIKKQMNEGAFGPSFNLDPNKQLTVNIGAKVETIATQNVVGLLEGSDPVLKEEYVAIGAHYDHVGDSPQSGCIPSTADDTICNGADDDGSGTAAVLAIAEALAQGTARPKRSIIFIWHAGEEKGLWGSQYFTENPPVPINQIITQLNIDMIGRSKREGDTDQRNLNLSGPNEIYVIGSKIMSTDLGELSDAVNKSYLNLKFNYKYDDPNDSERLFYRSDHYNYAKKGIPIIFYFDGVHEDYHRPSDHADRIDYVKMEKVTRTIFATLWKLSNVPSRPRVDKPVPVQLSGN
ncbi:MAG TPA: M20/M25/M40 family metallo-hydrolase [Blastocatellia bacterium]|nr:M20/M25/M40 family metallo-hydrolase [Blastocatellia bacterium]